MEVYPVRWWDWWGGFVLDLARPEIFQYFHSDYGKAFVEVRMDSPLRNIGAEQAEVYKIKKAVGRAHQLGLEGEELRNYVEKFIELIYMPPYIF